MSLPGFEIVALMILVFTGAFFGTAFMRYLAKRYGWMVMPREDRWHKKPAALHGGIGFYPVFVLGVVWGLSRTMGDGWSGWRSIDAIQEPLLLTIVLLSGSLLMLLFGLWDDIKQFRPEAKLLCELITASLFILAGGVFPLTGIHLLDLLVTYFWFVGIINAVNMLDNMDGLSSGVVILAGITLTTLAWQSHGNETGAPFAVILGVVFVSALLGFWVHNRPPAAIFMGDSGSLFIGYVLACLAVPSPLNGYMGIRAGESLAGSVMALLIPTTVLAVPIFDTTLVTLTRLWRAQNPSQGGRDHSSHRLVGLGLPEKKAVWLLYSLAAFGGIVAVLMQRFPDQSLPLFVSFGLVLVLTGVYLGHIKVQQADPEKAPPAWTPLISHLLYKRRAAEILLDTILVVVCFYGAYLLRFEGELSEGTLNALLDSLPIVVSSCLVANFLAGLYRGNWRLISVADVPVYAGGVMGGIGFSLVLVTMIFRFETGHSRSAYLIFGLLFFLALIGFRLSFRLLESTLYKHRSDTVVGNRYPVLIYGAGRGGKLLCDEVMLNPQLSEYMVVGYIDDDPRRAGQKLCGVPIKHGPKWFRRSWDSLPEIWISSRFIPDERAEQLFHQRNGRATVRRMRLQMDLVQEVRKREKKQVVN